MFLAYKPVFIRDGKLYPINLPDFEIPPQTILDMYCPQHEEPDENCNCGVLTTRNWKNVAKFYYQEDPDVFVLIMQVLGVVVNGDYLRSQGAFTYGIIKPWNMDMDDMEDLMFKLRSYRLILFKNHFDAKAEVEFHCDHKEL